MHTSRATVDMTGEKQASLQVYILRNLNCANCAAKIEEVIRQQEGIREANFTLATQQLRVHSIWDKHVLLHRIQEICDRIEEGVEVEFYERRSKGSGHTGCGCDGAETSPASYSEEAHEHNSSIPAIVVGAIVLGMTSFTDWVPAHWTTMLLLLTYALLAWRTLWTAVKNIVKGNVFDENFLISVATLGAVAIKEYPEAVGVMLFYQIGTYFEERATEKSRSAIMETVDMRPETVRRWSQGQVAVIPAEQAVVGDLVEVRAGDRIPLDGVVVEGESRVDTAPVTGEPVPVTVVPGSEVISGCVNQHGRIVFRVEKILAESMVTRILDAVENAAATKPKIDRFITRFARVYTPIVVGIAVLTAVVPSLLTGNWEHWLYTALTFLVISCPCALVLSVPLAFFGGIGTGSRKGILFKGGLSIEALKNIKVVALDKTGTVTTGEFAVQLLEAEESISKDEILAYSAALELTSTHPIAQSIVAMAQAQKLVLPKATEIEEWAGEGIVGMIGGQKILCGNRRLLARYEVVVPAFDKLAYGTEVLVAIDGVYQGRLLIADRLKEDSPAAIGKLKQLGLTTVMLTGDTAESANYMATEAGLDVVKAQLLPQDKVSEMGALRAQFGPVLFVGDGINDAPVLAGADVGGAMGSGADAAIEAADVVFMRPQLSAVVEAIRLAKDTVSVAWQNVFLALAIKAVIMVIGLFGYASMWLAVFADTGVSMLCILNSVRLLYK